MEIRKLLLKIFVNIVAKMQNIHLLRTLLQDIIIVHMNVITKIKHALVHMVKIASIIIVFRLNAAIVENLFKLFHLNIRGLIDLEIIIIFAVKIAIGNIVANIIEVKNLIRI